MRVRPWRGASEWCSTLGQALALLANIIPENTKGGSITVPLTSCLTGLDLSVLQIKTKIVSSLAADSKPVKQEVNGTMILPPLVFPVYTKAEKLARRNALAFCLQRSKQLFNFYCRTSETSQQWPLLKNDSIKLVSTA